MTEQNVDLGFEQYDAAWGLVEHYLEPIKHYFVMDGVSEIMINAHNKIFIERFGKTMKVKESFKSEYDTETLILQIANALGQGADKDTHPIIDARLPDGTRVCCTFNTVSTGVNTLTFRVFPKVKITADMLVEYKSLTPDMLDYLKKVVLLRGNMLVSGGTGSGKTTILNCLSEYIPECDRVITCEDTKELQVNVVNMINMEAPQRRKQSDDQIVIDLAFLIKTTLRQKPSRIIVGEIRNADASFAFLQAINTGHSGCWSTLHANSPEKALKRIQTLVASSGDLPYEVVRDEVRSNLNVIIQAEDTPNDGKRIVEIAEVQEDGSLQKLFYWDFKAKEHKADSQALSESVVLTTASDHGI